MPWYRWSSWLLPTRRPAEGLRQVGTSENQAVAYEALLRWSCITNMSPNTWDVGPVAGLSSSPRTWPRSTAMGLSIPLHSCPILPEQLVIRADLFPNVEGKLPIGPNLGRLLERPRIVREGSLNNPCRQKGDQRLGIHETRIVTHEDKPQPSRCVSNPKGKGRASRPGIGGER